MRGLGKNLDNVRLKSIKQGLCLQGVSCILGLRLVAKNRLERVYGKVNLSCFQGSGTFFHLLTNYPE